MFRMIKMTAITVTGLYLALQFGAENRYDTATAAPLSAAASATSTRAGTDVAMANATSSPSILAARRQNSTDAMLIPASLGTTSGTRPAQAEMQTEVTVPEAAAATAPAIRPEPMPGPPLKPSPEYRQPEAEVTPITAAIPGATSNDLRFISANGLNIRAGSGTGFAIVGRASRGAQVAVLTETGGWSQVHMTASGTEGWVASKFLSITAP
jgi:uncharacterized protein YgiM (DUF1202 family)